MKSDFYTDKDRTEVKDLKENSREKGNLQKLEFIVEYLTAGIS